MDALGMTSKARTRREVAAYSYTDADGHELYQAVRFEPKGFAQRHANGEGWTWSYPKGVEPVPYRLPDLLEAIALGKTVYVVEGEKDADALWKRGVPATCNHGGAGKWGPAHARYLKGARVMIVADRDASGIQHARDVARSIKGIADATPVLPAVEVPHADTCDHLGDGHGLDDWIPLTKSLADAIEAQEQEPARTEDTETPSDWQPRDEVESFFGERDSRVLRDAEQVRGMVEGEPLSPDKLARLRLGLEARYGRTGATVWDRRVAPFVVRFDPPAMDDAAAVCAWQEQAGVPVSQLVDASGVLPEEIGRAVVPFISYQGQQSCLYAHAKTGKTSLIAAGAARVTTGGTFLGEPVEQGSVLWVRPSPGEGGRLETVRAIVDRFDGDTSAGRLVFVPRISWRDDPLGEIAMLIRALPSTRTTSRAAPTDHATPPRSPPASTCSSTSDAKKGPEKSSSGCRDAKACRHDSTCTPISTSTGSRSATHAASTGHNHGCSTTRIRWNCGCSTSWNSSR
jgi:hypothetical protein